MSEKETCRGYTSIIPLLHNQSIFVNPHTPMRLHKNLGTHLNSGVPNASDEYPRRLLRRRDNIRLDPQECSGENSLDKSLALCLATWHWKDSNSEAWGKHYLVWFWFWWLSLAARRIMILSQVCAVQLKNIWVVRRLPSFIVDCFIPVFRSEIDIPFWHSDIEL